MLKQPIAGRKLQIGLVLRKDAPHIVFVAPLVKGIFCSGNPVKLVILEIKLMPDRKLLSKGGLQRIKCSDRLLLVDLHEISAFLLGKGFFERLDEAVQVVGRGLPKPKRDHLWPEIRVALFAFADCPVRR